MTQWKPTSEGTFLLDGRVSFTYEENGLIVDCGGIAIQPGSWSLFRPDWQLGAPTVAQLERWKWWAVQWESGVIVVDCTDDAGEDYAISRASAFSKRPIARSAPVQRDATSGPLWVPMEVAE